MTVTNPVQLKAWNTSVYTLLSIQLEAAFNNRTKENFVVRSKIEPEQANMFDANASANLSIHIHVKMLFQFSYLNQNTRACIDDLARAIYMVFSEFRCNYV